MKDKENKNMSSGSQLGNNKSSFQTNSTTIIQSSVTTPNLNNNNDSLDTQNFLSPYTSNNFMAPPIGSIVRCTMCLGNTVQGKVLAYDQQTKMLALKTSIVSKQNLWDISLINVAWCSNLDVIEEPNEAPEILPTLNLQKLARRTKLNIETKNKEINAIGNDVSTLAQHLYLTVLKTLEEVEWDEKKIVVMNSVVIEPPYDVNNCFAKKGDNRALEHVRKIVKKFHEDYKIQQQQTETDQDNISSTNISSSLNNSLTSSSPPPYSSSSSVSSTNNNSEK